MTPQYILSKSAGMEPACGYEKNPEKNLRALSSLIDCLNWATEYAEPGYSDSRKGILFANWNYVSRRAQTLLEQYGYELEWDDEWTTCGNCNKALRTSPNSYGWQPSYVIENECEMYCLECADIENYLRGMENEPTKAVNVRKGIDPSEHGYTLLQDGFEHGFYPGQNDDPKEITKRIRATGNENPLLFEIDSVGQFDISFKVWEREIYKHWESNLMIALKMKLEDAESAAHQGQCDEDVKELSKVPYIAKQLEVIDPDILKRELKEYGAWDAEELSDHEQNLQRVLWLAANDIVEESRSK